MAARALGALLLLAVTTLANAQPLPAADRAAVGGKESDGKLLLVVALFRHGIRPPLPKFAEEAHAHSKDKWPPLEEWCAANWGDLTANGRRIGNALGSYYATRYKEPLQGAFKAYLWADVDPRTRDTALALSEGFEAAGNRDVTVRYNSAKPDPLFHAFAAKCGNPSAKDLLAISANLNANLQSYFDHYKPQLDDLSKVLDCPGLPQCVPLSAVRDNTAGYCSPATASCSSPLKWEGQFPYASSSSETFLLEYANNMPYGWGRVSMTALKNMLALHEFFFDQTQREPYLASIDASNLLKEILDLVRRKAGWKIEGCPHGPADAKFVGLVGHDTNLASVGALLKLGWRFEDPQLPPDTLGLPANDALPAGALVFELRERPSGPPSERHFLRVVYITKSLDQMRNNPTATTAFALPAVGKLCQGQPDHCDIPLIAFNQLVSNSMAVGKQFLSRCEGERQVCGPPS